MSSFLGRRSTTASYPRSRDSGSSPVVQESWDGRNYHNELNFNIVVLYDTFLHFCFIYYSKLRPHNGYIDNKKWYILLVRSFINKYVVTFN